MKLQRTVAPTAAPISFSNLVLGALCLIRGGAEHRNRLIGELKAKFSVQEVFLVSSGKAALAVILNALAAGSSRRQVVIPAYTCFSVPSAIVKAGLEVVLCDVDPETLDFNFLELEGLLSDDVLCVVPTHLFGFAADVNRVRRLCEGKDIQVVEDAAQAMGGRSGEDLLGTLGDVSFFSLGRGKNLTCGTGGIILTRSRSIAAKIKVQYAALPEAPRGEVLRNWFEMVMMHFFIRPWLYWVPAGLPFLRLGETKFYPDFPIFHMDEARAGQLRGWDQRLTRANRDRAACATWLIEGLDLPMKNVWALTHSDAVYLRLPVMVQDRSSKAAICRQSRESGAGVSASYPTTIQEIPELIGRIADRRCPGAQEIIDRLVTLPTHRHVKEQDRRKIDRILGCNKLSSAPLCDKAASSHMASREGPFSVSSK